MSKKFLMQQSSTGVSNKKVVSKFGMKIMEKLGWTNGEGLGKNKSGIKECIQIKRREDNLGLGLTSSAVANMNWKNQWWENNYDQILKNIKIGENNNTNEEGEESEEEKEKATSISTEQEEEKQPKQKMLNKKRNRVFKLIEI